MKQLITAFLLIFSMQTAWAIDLQTAKDQGLVGEANTGYLAPVSEPASADVQELIRTVNAKRREQFERTARSTDTSVRQVSHRFYELAVQRTESGHYYQDANGRWIRK